MYRGNFKMKFQSAEEINAYFKELGAKFAVGHRDFNSSVLNCPGCREIMGKQNTWRWDVFSFCDKHAEEYKAIAAFVRKSELRKADILKYFLRKEYHAEYAKAHKERIKDLHGGFCRKHPDYYKNYMKARRECGKKSTQGM
jgi:hypothetical protein